jgi:hypothetical protein
MKFSSFSSTSKQIIMVHLGSKRLATARPPREFLPIREGNILAFGFAIPVNYVNLLYEVDIFILSL